MNNLDIFIIGVLTFFALKGLMKGAIKEIIGLFVLFIAIIFAPIFSDQVGNFLKINFNLSFEEGNLYFIGYFTIIIMSLLIGGLISFILNLTVKFIGLNIINILAGLIVGLFKGLLILVLILSLGMKIDVSKNYLSKYTKNSLYVEKIISFGNKFLLRVEESKKLIIKEKKNIENTTSLISNNILNSKYGQKIKSELSNKETQTAIKENINKNIKNISESIEKIEK